ncbi:hypothetical protein Pelo_13974 [Pelomyxa schiedti]|nr:hypothetical protein Pelo_13974 [Pelomyxa schiedti]
MLSWLEKMHQGDPEALLLHLDALESLINANLTFPVMEKLVSLLTKMELRQSERATKVYKMVMESSFIRNPRYLRSYIMKLVGQKHGAALDNVVELLQELVGRSDSPLTAMRELPIDVFEAEANQKYITPELRVAVNSIANSHQIHTNASAPTMDSDFRSLSVFPSTDEILRVPFGNLSSNLRPNRVLGKYPSIENYLDTHFQLLREDCIAPLREGIQEYIKKQTKSRDLRIYHNVQLQGIQCCKAGVFYRISFRLESEKATTKIVWERSKRLMFGSLLCLSNDSFNTLIWATVANRDPQLLSTQQLIDIKFPSGYESMVSPTSIYTMVESATTYFEAYRWTLRALQEFPSDGFPFKEYLIDCEATSRPPRTISMHGADRFDLTSVFENGMKVQFPILSEWPVLESSMDSSQLEAFKHALTHEFAIIQGPPGTGKTFVGLKIMRALLDNSRLRNPGPILVICYTNHALDQFLEGLLAFEENVVRIGGRSKSELLKKHNLRQLMSEGIKPGSQFFKSKTKISQQIDELQRQIENAVQDCTRLVLSNASLEKVASSEHIASLFSRNGESGSTQRDRSLHKILTEWLQCDPRKVCVPPGHIKRTVVEAPVIPEGPKATSSASPDDTEELCEAAEEEEDDFVIAKIQQDRMVGDEEDVDVGGAFYSLSCPTETAELNDYRSPSHVASCENVWALGVDDRKLLYLHWRQKYFYYSQENLSNLCKRYESLCLERESMEDQLRYQLLNSTAVIGMTTTGVAKFHRLVQALRPEIIICEEAAEVLECHIVTALGPHTSHLILIGDHDQLRPSTAVYKLSTQFNLDVSLFERMVRNHMPLVTLTTQRRMRPTIASLLHNIYPSLQNHERVHGYPNIAGVACNVFFLDHKFPESRDTDTSSKSNQFEVLFVTQFTDYLIKQGYETSKVTVLTPYCGQLLALRREFRVNPMISGVYVTTVDNYQGEENDIIILSLVRSNDQGVVGFLKTSNRICVALSRARHGLYIIGNSTVLRKVPMWKSVISVLEAQKNFGESLVLRCQTHTSKSTKVQHPNDFQRVVDGGCDKPCGTLLECGHVCPRMCHPYSHSTIPCTQPCTRTMECGHTCTKLCSEECGGCEVLVGKKLKCGHRDKVACGTPVEEHMCARPCERLLPCGHKCTRLCGEGCLSFCHEKVEKALKCGHTQTVECSANIDKIKCKLPCGVLLLCGHLCSGQCSACKKESDRTIHTPCVTCQRAAAALLGKLSTKKRT